MRVVSSRVRRASKITTTCRSIAVLTKTNTSKANNKNFPASIDLPAQLCSQSLSSLRSFLAGRKNKFLKKEKCEKPVQKSDLKFCVPSGLLKNFDKTFVEHTSRKTLENQILKARNNAKKKIHTENISKTPLEPCPPSASNQP
jgi:hypothetical protein